MLDTFGIAFRCLGIKAEADEKAQHDLVPPPAFLRQRAARLCQKDRPILRAGDQPLARETVEGLAHGRHLHAKPGGDVHRARLALIVDQFGDQFDIVLGQFIASGFAHTLKRPGAQVRRPVIRGGLGCRIELCHPFSVARDGLTSKGAGQNVSTV
jgi:hypothetical protein